MTPVILKFAEIKDGTVFFTVEDDHYTVINPSCSVDDVVANTDWHVFSVYHPLKHEVPEAMVNLRDILTKLSSIRNERREYMCDESLRSAEHVYNGAAMIAIVAMTGLYPREVSKLT